MGYIEGRSAPHLNGMETDVIQLLGHREHIFCPHSCRQGRLVPIPKGRIRDLDRLWLDLVHSFPFPLLFEKRIENMVIFFYLIPCDNVRKSVNIQTDFFQEKSFTFSPLTKEFFFIYL